MRRIKFNSDDLVNKYKARLVIKDYAQLFGIYYGDTFTSIAHIDTIHLIYHYNSTIRWNICHLDVKSIFLNGELKKEIYIDQLERCGVKSQEDKFYHLKEAFYRLK